jgi:hypothetical protein
MCVSGLTQERGGSRYFDGVSIKDALAGAATIGTLARDGVFGYVIDRTGPSGRPRAAPWMRNSPTAKLSIQSDLFRRTVDSGGVATQSVSERVYPTAL